ncbi:IclR family transcriptional regulator [Halopiger thermotolerans]
MTREPVTKSKTTRTSLAIIEALRELDGATLEELSEYLELSTSTVHRHLVTLQEESYVVREGSIYRIGLQFLTLGGYAQRCWRAYPKIKEKVDRLAAETGERAQFIVEEQGERVYLYTEVGESAVQTGAHIGKRGNIHASAAGKAILAHLPEERVREIVDKHGLPRTGRNTITTEAALFEELQAIRDRGYALNEQETTEGVHAVGAVVTDDDGTVVGALSVSGPAHRLKREVLGDELAERVLGAANELELHIQHSID